MLITVSKTLYSKEVLLKTAYSLTDKVYIHLDQNEESWIISWKSKAGQQIDPGEMENELITQSLRAALLDQNAEIRKIILARAFASTILDDQKENTDQALISEEQIGFILDEEEKKAILKGWFDQ